MSKNYKISFCSVLNFSPQQNLFVLTINNYEKINSKRCHRCVVIYEKHKNVLQYKESECEEMDHFNPSALSSRSIIKSDQIRGVALSSHPNMSGKLSASDQLYRSHDDRIIKDDCKQ